MSVMADWSTEEVVDARLRTQRLSSAALGTPGDVVRLLTCVQSQERDHGFFSLGLRSGAATYGSVRAAFDRGEFLRTHILRPTWHFVRPEDLRWILALTSPRVERSMAARHRQLGFDDAAMVDRSFATLGELLAGGRCLTRAQIGAEFTSRGSSLPEPGERLGHLLLIAELRALISSGPLQGRQSTYALVDEVVPPAPKVDRDDAVRRLVQRFFAGHGPASVADFTRWSSLIASDTRSALDDLKDRLDVIAVEGVKHWYDPGVVPPLGRDGAEAWLFPVYDEAVLTYRKFSFPTPADHPHPEPSDSFYARVVYNRTNVGIWKRTIGRDRVTIHTRLSPSLDRRGQAAVRAAAVRSADFYQLPLDYG